MMFRPNRFLLLFGALLFVGCGSERAVDEADLASMSGGDLGETVKVSGSVLIGGAPTAGVNIYAYTKESGREAVAQTRTKADGTYCWNTHIQCDGIAPGTYMLAFAHIPKEPRGDREGEDLLKGKFRNPTKIDYPLVIESGVPQENVVYTLE